MVNDHEHFLNNLTAAPQDISRPVLEDLISKGYQTVRWVSSPSAVDGKCISMDGEMFPIQEFISNLQHDAPVYEKTHVGCTCTVVVSGEGLNDVVVNAFGIVG